MAKKGYELAVQDQATLDKADNLLADLWQGISQGLTDEAMKIGASGLYPESLREANVAKGLVEDWKVLSEKAIKSPGSLTLRSCELTRTQKLVETELFDGDGERVVLNAKYSILSAVFDSKPFDFRFGDQPEEGTPQLEVSLAELYTDSLRQARAAMSGTLHSQIDVGLTKSPEGKCDRVNDLEAQAFLIGRIASRRFSMLGKTTWHNSNSHSIRTWDLAGFKLHEAISADICPFEVHRRMRFGKLDDQTGLHPIAYQHDLLAETAPALFSAVEPFAKMVVKNIEKSKR